MLDISSAQDEIKTYPLLSYSPSSSYCLKVLVSSYQDEIGPGDAYKYLFPRIIQISLIVMHS